MSDPGHTPCPVCRSDERREFLRAPDRFSVDLSSSFRIQECASCSMVYLSPRPTEADSGKYYQHEEYLPFSSTQESRSITESVYRLVRRFNLRWKRNLIERYWRGGTAKEPGRLLDVGCGTGEFLGAVRKRGWQVEGVERDERASSWARESLGISVSTGDVQELSAVAGPFNVITMWHVLEHLYDPSKTLRRIGSLLDREGFLLIALPNIKSIDALVYRSNWIALDTPRHVNHFAPLTLTRLLADAGFVPLARRQLPFDAFFNTLMSEQLAARRSRYSGLLWPFRFIRAGLVSVLSLAGGSRLFSAGKGATMVYLFTKREV